ncbi:NnrU family protein [Photobacterium lipolyticum]|uniref:NnrU family protein n=1 Tax=Photobacterium lipolyticum TaxID=266810 RepID=A0A2T3N3G6_9GAMM|nr:NnrU family protein [Photobacterium lipolyticum]PSW06902.1 NnrU family protein [Photobacterium lipolyticum]
MEFLLLGLFLFIAIHLLPTMAGPRQQLIARLGRMPYLALFSIISVIALLLIFHGFALAPKDQLWAPLSFSRPLAHALMPVVFILLTAAYLDTHIRAKLKHPMLIAICLWAFVHLLANGDLASTLLFGGFFVYALIDIYRAKPRSSLVPRGKPKARFDVIAVVVGLILFGLVLRGHQTLFGVAVIG